MLLIHKVLYCSKNWNELKVKKFFDAHLKTSKVYQYWISTLLVFYTKV